MSTTWVTRQSARVGTEVAACSAAILRCSAINFAVSVFRAVERFSEVFIETHGDPIAFGLDPRPFELACLVDGDGYIDFLKCRFDGGEIHLAVALSSM